MNKQTQQLDLLSISITCKSLHEACSDCHAFSVLDFRIWKTISQVARLRFVGPDPHSLSEDRIFDCILNFAVRRSLGCVSTIIFPNHSWVPHAIVYVKQRCPNIKAFHLDDEGEYWHGRVIRY
ncbi:hypothetical protein NE237_032092 [Protea cynaroides]|uniref:F-box protein n=1 Tax=Protea cynaroides TaxID=273540 RepID=A0A9Q0R379_9MAGN|nr:hypothetical protein NE237_032092 [Protea cynaroides]